MYSTHTGARESCVCVCVRGNTSARPKCGLTSTDGARSLNPSTKFANQTDKMG